MPKKILVVDDEEDIRDLVGFCLEKEGYEVTMAENGTEALSVFESTKPDLIVTDINMPGGDDGWVFLANLDKLGVALPPVIIMTGYSKNESKITDAVSVFLQKPFSMDEFVETVQGVFADAV